MARNLYKAKILDAKSALNAVSDVVKDDILGHAESVNIYVKFSVGSSAGAVMVEVSADPLDADTWASLATITWAAASKTHNYAVVGNHIALRLRISTGIVGGTVDGTIAIAG